MSCSIAEIGQSESADIENTISQEIVRNLQAKEQISSGEGLDRIPFADGLESVADDAMLAKMFQMQINEYELNSTKRKYNGHSKVSMSLENCDTSLNYDVEGDSDEEEIIHIGGGKDDWDKFDLLENKVATMPQNVLKKGKKVETKRDVKPDTCKLSKKVFNSLKSQSYTEEFCRYKVYEVKRPMYKLLGIDEYTWCLIREMIKEQIFKKVTSIVNFDNEAVTIRAIQSWTPSDCNRKCKCCEIMPIYCSIKVFKVTSLSYGKSRTTARQKAEREAANYAKLRAAGLSCPDVIIMREHVLVMSYLGPTTLNEEKIMPYNYEYVYGEVIMMMKEVYAKANLIHANLSEHNIRYYYYRVYFTNLSQSVDPSHENAFDLLYRDCTNITNFFTRRRVLRIKTPELLFRYITGRSYHDKPSLLKLQKNIQKRVFESGKI